MSFLYSLDLISDYFTKDLKLKFLSNGIALLDFGSFRVQYLVMLMCRSANQKLFYSEPN